MSSFSMRARRRWLPACVISAAAAALLAVPGVAAAERFPSCTEGSKINGEGSTLQETAMKKVWGEVSPHAYNAAGQKNPKACPGGPTVTYNTHGKTGSGPGMENWYVLEEYGPETQAFAGTDNPPDETIKEKIEKEGTGGKVLTIPTLQAAIALIVHLPEGCTAEAAPGTKPLAKLKRLVLGEKTVESIFRRVKTKWSQLKDGKSKLLGCSKAQQESEITRVVRKEGSGTTATFKKTLELINGKGEAELGKVCNDAGTETWLQCAEPAENTEWPQKATKLVEGKGSGGVVEKVEETPGSIGYVNLANARKGGKGPNFVPPAGGEGKNMFWVEVENGQKETVEGKALKVFTDPSTNGEEAKKDKSNCEETPYVAIVPKTGKAEKGKFPPSSTEKLWNLVSAEKKVPNYPFCGFTYDLALTKYSGFKGASKAEATSAGDFLEFVLNNEAEGGQKTIEEEQDYLGLPTNPEPKKNVLKIAQEGAAKVQF
jgi:ABC-type phosphate transport system substrate-binding protein